VQQERLPEQELEQEPEQQELEQAFAEELEAELDREFSETASQDFLPPSIPPPLQELFRRLLTIYLEALFHHEKPLVLQEKIYLFVAGLLAFCPFLALFAVALLQRRGANLQETILSISELYSQIA